MLIKSRFLDNCILVFIVLSTYNPTLGIICDNWQCYQAFRKWYDDNFYNVGTERMHIDKDILYKNNRVKYLFIEKEEMN